MWNWARLQLRLSIVRSRGADDRSSSHNIRQIIINFIKFILDFINQMAHIASDYYIPMDISNAICPECKNPMTVSRMACPNCQVTLEGAFEVPQLAQLKPEDQAFVIAFVRH